MNFKKLPVYKIVINMDDDETGMTAISMVDFPAIETNWQAFADKKSPMKFEITDEKEHKVTGPAIIAGMPIYRWSWDLGEYYVVFEADEIDKIIEKYSRNNLWNSVSLQHDGNPITTAIMTEYYQKDTAKGINPKGYEEVSDKSLFVTYKITDDELWNTIISGDGQLNGFSIEIMADMELLDETIDDGQEDEDYDVNDDFWSWLLEALGFSQDNEYLLDGDGEYWLDEDGKRVKAKCEKCGGDVGVYIKGEPVFLCSECGEYYGTVKFPDDLDFANIKKKSLIDTIEKAIDDQKEIKVKVKNGRTITGEAYTVFTNDGSNVAMWDGKQWHVINETSIEYVETTGRTKTVDWTKAIGNSGYEWVRTLITDTNTSDVNKVVTAPKNDIERSIIEHLWVNLSYDDFTDNACKGYRQCQVMEYGYTTNNNAAIRVYETMGATHSNDMPGWRTLRLDRITNFRINTILEPYTTAPEGFRHNGEGEDRDGFVTLLRSDL